MIEFWSHTHLPIEYHIKVNLHELCKLANRVDYSDEELAVLRFGKRPTLVGSKKHRNQFFQTF